MWWVNVASDTFHSSCKESYKGSEYGRTMNNTVSQIEQKNPSNNNSKYIVLIVCQALYHGFYMD